MLPVSGKVRDTALKGISPTSCGQPRQMCPLAILPLSAGVPCVHDHEGEVTSKSKQCPD